MTQSHPAPRGLEGVIAATSAISSIVGDRLTYRGIDIDELASQSTFEEVVWLLWNGDLPPRAQLDEFRHMLSLHRELPGPVLDLLRRIPRQAEPTQILRTAVSLLPFYQVQAGSAPQGTTKELALRLVAAFPTLVAAIHQLRHGREPVPPEPELAHAANFLYMLHHERPSPMAAHSLEVCLIVHADHELNASTFAARVAASTLSDIDSAVIAALCALQGQLHGGATEAVMHMLEQVDSVANAAVFVRETIARGERIVGFGHRVYRQGDPRARWLRLTSEGLAADTENPRWHAIAGAIEKEVRDRTGLLPNVDLYAGCVYSYLGIPPALSAPTFAVSRVSGWIAHILEQQADNRLIRPRADYVGPAARPYIPLDER